MEEEKQNPKKPEKEMNSAHFCWCINQSIEFPKKKKNKTTNELDPWKLQMTLHYIWALILLNANQSLNVSDNQRKKILLLVFF